MAERTFESLWRELEPHVLTDRRVIARAILALAVNYREERDDPKFHDKLRRDRTFAAEATLDYLPAPEEIHNQKEQIQKTWSEAEKRNRRGLTGPPEPVQPPQSSAQIARRSKDNVHQ